MLPFKYPVPQTDPPKSPRETLPTMYDLPSEDPEEPGLPDEFHDLQPQLLSLTFRPQQYPPSRVFTGTDMNLYYDVRHALWYKRPDWFGVVGVPRLYDQVDMRLSYVVWQEGVNPFVVVELLSPGTEKEDLGENASEKLPLESEDIVDNGHANQPEIEEKPPRKWDVYEQILHIPYYVIFSRYTNQLRAFKLDGAHYQELELQESRVWMPELELGLGLWQELSACGCVGTMLRGIGFLRKPNMNASKPNMNASKLNMNASKLNRRDIELNKLNLN